MAIVRWNDPFREFAHLQNRINRVFSDAYGQNDEGLTTSGTWVPPVDIYQNGDHEIVLKAELPDLTREDIDITVDNDDAQARLLITVTYRLRTGSDAHVFVFPFPLEGPR